MSVPARRLSVLSMGGEGIGPEIVREGERALRAAAKAFGLDVTIERCEVGLAAEQKHGTPFPPAVEERCDALAKAGGAILFGAVSDEPIGILRQRYDLFANLRPARPPESLLASSPLRPDLVRDLDVLIVRELVSGIYYGAAREGTSAAGAWASQELYYDEAQVRRIARVALEAAAARRKRVAYVHKGNVVKGVFALWARVVAEEAARFPGVEVADFLVDNMAMQLVRRPRDFDVILAENMFGDILSDLLAGIVGSIGVLPSASLNASGFGLYESIGGTAPDIAGRDLANPISTILSVAMMCEHTMGRADVRRRIEDAVDHVLAKMRTPDISAEGLAVVGTAELGDAVARAIERPRQN